MTEGELFVSLVGQVAEGSFPALGRAFSSLERLKGRPTAEVEAEVVVGLDGSRTSVLQKIVDASLPEGFTIVLGSRVQSVLIGREEIEAAHLWGAVI